MSRQKRKRESLGSLLEEPHKRDTQPMQARRRRRRARCIWPWLVAWALTLVLGVVTVIILYEPEVFGMGLTGDLTATVRSINSTEDALAATAQHQARYDFANESTRIALDNRQQELDHDATQMAVNEKATQTAIAASNAQQATQAALDYSATQSALDFQGTQAALHLEATAAALGITVEAPSINRIPTQAPPPTASSTLSFEDRFEAGLDGERWQFGALEDWRVNDDGILAATRSGAWLLTRSAPGSSFSLEVDLLPLVGPGLGGDYFVLVTVPDSPNAEKGIALRLSYNGERLAAAGLYQFARDQLLDDAGLLNADLQAIAATETSVSPGSELAVQVDVQGERIIAMVNGQQVLDVTLVDPLISGVVGLQMPVSTRIVRVAVSP
jgi:hypothetical protein